MGEVIVLPVVRVERFGLNETARGDGAAPVLTFPRAIASLIESRRRRARRSLLEPEPA